MIAYSNVYVHLWIIFFLTIIYVCIVHILRLFLLDREI